MDKLNLERLYEPKVSNSLPKEIGVYLKCFLTLKSRTPSIPNTQIEGVLYLVPKNQRIEPWVTEYFFKPLNEDNRNYGGSIRNIYLHGIDKDYTLINSDTTLYPVRPEDGKFN